MHCEAAMPCPFTGTCRAAGLPALDEDGRATTLVMSRTDSNDPAARFAAEAAARRLALKRQCCARSRADAEPRVYPRPYQLAALRLLSTTARRSGPLRSEERRVGKEC